MRSVRTWIALASLAIVLLVAVVDVERTSPGPLSAVHAGESELVERCSACHGGWFSSMQAACLECHEPIDAQLASGEGLHGALADELGARCALCHSEHHGATFAVVNRRSFALAGVPDPKAFDHQLVGFAMAGKHLEQECSKCHENAEVAILTAGESRFLGLDQDCASCHEDPHEGRFALSCASCHGQESWEQLFSLGHDEHLPLVGGHAALDCRECHAETSPHALEVLGGRAAKPEARACTACHESPHTRPFVLAAAQLAELAPAASCVVCHEPEHASFREEGLLVTPQEHAATGFPLDEPHAEVLCAECHAPEQADYAARHPGRSPAACSACHADPHGGQFAEGLFAGRECTACHDALRFEPSAFDLAAHEATSFPLAGAHREAACEDCHQLPRADVPRVFHGTAARCEQCHQDAHAGFFDARLAAQPLGEAAGTCASCHDSTSFAVPLADGFEHERWTGFAVRGAHAQGECESCHERAAEPDALGRSFGRVAERFGAFRGCVTCHADPHVGRFDGPDLPASLDGRADCARCHVESSFRAFPHGFEHGAWTGFAVVGAHAAAGCSACHAPWRKPDELGRTWGAARGSACADCHQDPHAGQFAVGGVTECERCHDAAREDYSSFDHQRDSRFPLDETHAPLACAACHKPWPVEGVGEVVRYRPLGTTCVDCHGVQEDLLLRRRRKGR